MRPDVVPKRRMIKNITFQASVTRYLGKKTPTATKLQYFYAIIKTVVKYSSFIK